MENPIYTVPELMRIVRVVGDHVPIKVRFKSCPYIYGSFHYKPSLTRHVDKEQLNHPNDVFFT